MASEPAPAAAGVYDTTHVASGMEAGTLWGVETKLAFDCRASWEQSPSCVQQMMLKVRSPTARIHSEQACEVQRGGMPWGCRASLAAAQRCWPAG